MKRFLSVLFFVITLIGIPASAQEIPEPVNAFVSDYANLLDPETEARITQQIQQIRNDLDLELTVVTVESRHDYGNVGSIEEFATTLFNTWGVGNATRNDGVLVLVARSDREMRIELGSSYGPIYDDRMKLVIDNHFIPYFRGNEYARGIESGVLEIIKRLRPAYNADQLREEGDISRFNDTEGSGLWAWIKDKFPLFIFLGIGAFILFEGKLREALVGMQKCPNCGLRQLSRERTVLESATRSSSGSERVLTECSSCHYHAEEIRIIPERSSSNSFSSGGGGGFGGGSSSGGGASGRW